MKVPYPYRLYTSLKTPRYMKRLGASLGAATVRDFVRTPEGALIEAPVPGSEETVLVRSGTSDRRSYEQVFIDQEYAIDFGVPSPTLIVDGGANAGYAAVFFALRFPTATVLAVEPEATNLELLARNVAAFGDRVRIVKGALWHRETLLGIANLRAPKWSFEVGEDGGGDVRDRVPAHTIESLLQRSGHERVDILKLDIEGAEYELLAHADRWIGHVGAMVAELHPRKKPGVEQVYERAIHGRARRRGRSGENRFALLEP